MRLDAGKAALAGLALFALLVSALLWWVFAQPSAPEDTAAAEEAASPASPISPLGPEGIRVAAMEVHEICTELQPEEELRYGFQSTKPLDFDIHFHDAGLVYTPVEIKAVKEQQGVFQAETRQSYCFMWTSQSLKDTWLKFQVEGP